MILVVGGSSGIGEFRRGTLCTSRHRIDPLADRLRQRDIACGRTDKNKGPGVAAKPSIHLPNLVGGAGFEPATPAV
jgi:hypothetical protein